VRLAGLPVGAVDEPALAERRDGGAERTVKAAPSFRHHESPAPRRIPASGTVHKICTAFKNATFRNERTMQISGSDDIQP
jgi:hypothetical protein